jgi:uncharacterized protein (TIGR02466 family)
MSTRSPFEFARYDWPMKRTNHGRVLVAQAANAVRNGHVPEARALMDRARALAPGDPEVLKRLADLSLVLNDLPTASERLAEAIAQHPHAPWSWYHAQGETCTLLGKLDRAIPAFRAALVEAPDAVDTWRWLARVLRSVGDTTGAIEALRHVRRLSPDDWQTLSELGGTLTELRAFDEAAVLLEEARQSAGFQPIVAVTQARLEARRGCIGEAIATLQACLEWQSDYTPAEVLLASLLRDEHLLEDAARILRRAAARVPGDAGVALGFARVLLEGGNAHEALSSAHSFLARKPGHSGALAVEALARLALGDAQAASRLLDYERLVSARPLPVPDGFSDLAEFNASLASFAAQHRTLLAAPYAHATAAGLHSGSLLIDPSKPVLALQSSLRTAVAAYLRGVSDLSEHPFVANRPASAFFDMWCVVLPRGGHQVPHIHPEAWLSGVYYAQLPEALRNDAEREEGGLAFGEPDRSFPRLLEPRIVHVRPAEGLLVLFPSYFYHRTIPFDADGTRISVAFDLVPNSR